MLALLGMQYSKASSVPRIHNISTDTVNPPQFEKIVAIRKPKKPIHWNTMQRVGATASNSLSLGKVVRADGAVDEAVDRAEAVMRGMGLEILAVNKSTGPVEATATTLVRL